MLHSTLLNYQWLVGTSANGWSSAMLLGHWLFSRLMLAKNSSTVLARQNMTPDIHGKWRLHLLTGQQKIGEIQVICLSYVFDINYIYICFGGISPDTIPINGLQAGNCTVLVHPSLRIEHVHNPTAFAKNRRLFCSSSLLQKVKTRSENHWPVRKQAVLAELHWRLHRTGYFEPTANAEYRNIFHPLPVVLSMSTVQQKVGDFPTWSTGRPLWWNWNKQFTWCCCKY